MARISFPTSREVKCPLLLDLAQLEALDQIVDRYLGPMREYKEKRVVELASKKVRKRVLEGTINAEKAASYEIEYRKELISDFEYREARSVSLYLTKGREIQAHRLSEAVSQPVGEDELALGFSLLVRVGEINAQVRLRHGWIQEMSVEVEPNNVETAQEFFGALSNWASAIEAPKWQQRWSEHRWLASFLLVACLIFGLVLVPWANRSEAGKSASKEEARKLLAAGGINSSNEQHALGLLLAIESDYDSGKRPAPMGLKYWSYLSLGGLILIVAAICPRISIGLWKGRRRLNA